MFVHHFSGWSRRRAAVGVAVAAMLALAGCGSSSSSSSTSSQSASSSSAAPASSAPASTTPAPSTGATPALLNLPATALTGSATNLKGKKIAFLGCATVISWCAKWDPSVVADLKAAGASVSEQLYKSQTDPALQVQQLQEAITQQPAAIIIEPLAEPALVPELIKAKAAHIPVMFGGSVATPAIVKAGLVQSTDSVNHYQDGYFAAQALINGMKAEGKTSGNVIMISGNPADGGSSLARQAGFAAGLKKYGPSFKLVATADSNWDPTTAAQVSGPLLAKYSKQGVAGVYGISGYVAVGAIQAAKQAGLKIGVADKGIVFVGGNCSATSIVAMKAGQEYADFTEIPTQEAQQVTTATSDLIGHQSVPQVISPQLAEITPANLSKYYNECNY